MRYWKHYATGLATIGLLFACSGSGEEAAQDEPQEDKSPICFYKYNPTATTLEWTSFKYSDKAPVKGTFNDFTVDGMKGSDDIMVLLKSMTIEINTGSVETQNEDRNGKIAKHFFGTLETEKIKGKIVDVTEDGKATIELSLHGMTNEVSGTYTWEDNTFAFSGTMDVANWDGMAGINALNEICKDLHTGEDGVSKLWSTVDLSFKTVFDSDCE